MQVKESVQQLLSRIAELEVRLEESEQLIEAIKAGEVDALAITKDSISEVFTLQSADYAYRVLLESLNEGALNLSEDGLIVYTNIYFHELLNQPYEKVIGNSFFQFIHEDSKEAFNELFKKGLAGQSKGEINLSVGKKIIPVYVSLTSLYPNLPTVGMIVTDLSEKKNHERILEKKNKELLTANAELKHNRNFINNVLETSNSGVLSYVAIRENNEVVDFEIRYANEPALEQLNMPAEKVIGQRYLTVMPQAKKYGLWDRVTRVLNTRVSESHEVNSLIYPHRWFKVSYTPLDDGVTCTFVEITEQKQQAQFLEEKNIELAKSNAELTSFAYVASHDLQEPLRKIQIFSTRILQKELKNLSESGKDQFERMQIAAKRMQTLIEDLLRYSRTNTIERKLENTSLNEIVEVVKEDLKEEMLLKHATIEVAEICHVNVIPFQFRQLMQNLISNSLKFSSPDESPHIIIKSETGSGDSFNNKKLKDKLNYCHVSITDNGIGFEPEYSEKVFELFQRLHGKSEYSGTGIGLAIVKKIVENHNGIITATSELGKGTRFDIYIPAE